MVIPLDQRPRSGPYSGLNINSAKRFLTEQFRQAGLETPDMDARLLIMHVTGLTHAELITGGTDFLNPEMFETISQYSQRRIAGEPVDNIIGLRGFYGRDFKVTKDVLSPRPETELIIDLALDALCDKNTPSILDLGTGSGAIIITLLAQHKSAIGTAVDISAHALSVAQDNAKIHGVEDRLTLIKGDWFDPLMGPYDLIVSNPPYIDAKALANLPPEVAQFDPPQALSGGDDGLNAYRIITAKARDYLTPAGRVILEIGFDQSETVTALLQQAGFDSITCHRDLSGHPRILEATR